MVGKARGLIACCCVVASLAWNATLADAQALHATASCRDGMPHGAYELRSANGRLRVTGAFNRGRRTGSFIFWTSGGTRVAHVPYDEDQVSGTLSLWYADAALGAEAQQKLEAAFSAGRRHGLTRSWFADGRARAVFRYENDELAEARAWDASGAPLGDGAARERAARDRAGDEKYYASLDAIVRGHLPACAERGVGPTRAQASGAHDAVR
jgi:antitoxin component YwqK of YwqJK toxin-antitoxin module